MLALEYKEGGGKNPIKQGFFATPSREKKGKKKREARDQKTGRK